MAAPTGFLYGDSTPSPLKHDFLAFLRDAVDFSAEVLLCDARLKDAVERVTQLADATEREIELAEVVVGDVARALSVTGARDPMSLAARCAGRIQDGARDLVRAEAEAARATVTAERAHLAQAASRDHEACAKAFEVLALRHTLPDAVGVTLVKLEGGSRYEAVLQCHTPYGLEWSVELEIPASHPLAQVLRIDRVVERLEIDAPEEGGWINKEVRIRPQRFDRLHLTGLSVHPAETAIRLRAGVDGGDDGFDVLLRNDPPRVDLVRIVGGTTAAEPPYNVLGEDLAKVQALRDGLATLATELAERKKSLQQASLDGTQLQKLESPRVVVERLLANIAPTVQEISRRSLSPGELVLKRLLDDNHREEVFVSKKELEQKLEPLPAELRAVFDALKLFDVTPASAPAPPAAAAKAPTSMQPSAVPLLLVAPKWVPAPVRQASPTAVVVPGPGPRPRAAPAPETAPETETATDAAAAPAPETEAAPSPKPPSIRPPRP